MTDKYIPHEWYETPRARLLCALRWFAWADFEDLLDALDSLGADLTERNALAASLSRLVQYGVVERRDASRNCRGRRYTPGRYQYRLKHYSRRWSTPIEAFA